MWRRRGRAVFSPILVAGRDGDRERDTGAHIHSDGGADGVTDEHAEPIPNADPRADGRADAVRHRGVLQRR